MVYCNESESVDGTRFQTEPCCTLKSKCFSLYGGQKKEMCTVHKQGEEHPRATTLRSGNKIRIEHFATWHYAEQAMTMPYTVIKLAL